MTSWINRSDEALMDMRKKLATAPGATSSESTDDPSTNSRLAASPQGEIERSGHCCKPAGREKGDSSSVKNVSGKTGRGKGEDDRNFLEDLPTLVAAAERVKFSGRSGARDISSSSQVCFKCGSTDHWARDCPKMDDGSSSPKKRNLGACAYGAWTCADVQMKVWFLHPICLHRKATTFNGVGTSKTNRKRKFPRALFCVLYPCSGLVCRYLMICCFWPSQCTRASLGLGWHVSDTSCTLTSSGPDEYAGTSMSRACWRIHGSAI